MHIELSFQSIHILTDQEKTNIEIEQEELIIKATQKDISHFESLYNKHYEPIFRYVFRQIGDEDESSDVVSKVFLNAMNAIHKYECRGLPFGAWLYRIASNETKKYFRKNSTRTLSIENTNLERILVCEEVEDNEARIKVVNELVKELDDEEIQILQLKYFDDQNFREIAYVLDKNESTVKMRLYRALNKIKTLYEKKHRD